MARYSSPHMRGSSADVFNRSDKKINRIFYAKPNQYRYPNGKTVPSGTPIRQLNDGTVMSGHRNTKSSRLLILSKTNKMRKTIGIDKKGKTIISNQKQPDVVARKRTITNNEMDISEVGGHQEKVMCNADMNYAQCRQHLVTNIPQKAVNEFASWYDMIGNDGYQAVLNGQVTSMEQLLPENRWWIFCSCQDVSGIGKCRGGTCCGFGSSSGPSVEDPYGGPNIPGPSFSIFGCTTSFM